MGALSDWISAVCSAVAAIVALLTLVTVYLAAQQILSRLQVYRLGISWKSLGPWKENVVKHSLFRMQTKIYTPKLSLAFLVTKQWDTEFQLPIGFADPTPKKSTTDPESGELGKTLAEASWVNFLEGIGIEPTKSSDLYEMQYQTDLVNGIVPMRWKGSDLVGICSILGFQAPADITPEKSSMPLPTQWNGPLGWIQFRGSADGCIAEFRRRALFENQLPETIHDYYRTLDVSYRKIRVVSRLWNSIGGFVMPQEGVPCPAASPERRKTFLGHFDGTQVQSPRPPGSPAKYDIKYEVLYLGGTDDWVQKVQSQANAILSPEKLPTEDLCKKLIENPDATDEQITAMMFGAHSDRPENLQRDALEKGRYLLADDDERGRGLPTRIKSDFDRIREVLGGNPKYNNLDGRSVGVINPCPGLLTIVVHGELAESRGVLFKRDARHEFCTWYIDKEEVNEQTHPYNLGRYYMNETLLKLVKHAALSLLPDGFYFSPSHGFLADVRQMWCHIEEYCNEQLDVMFPVKELDDWYKNELPEETGSTKEMGSTTKSQLYHAVKLCNESQRMKTTARSMSSVEDMKLISKASNSLRRMVSGDKFEYEADLTWAMLASPNLFKHLSKLFSDGKIKSVVEGTISSKDGKLDCAPAGEVSAIFAVPLVLGEQIFDGEKVLAAFLDVLLTWYWVEKRWTSDVAMYDTAIPQSVTMC
ncbi:hypothetical protein EDC01DRAFT_432681 [Geopyxis carbonaria]|nr:hypothetical protein EDC01DRAFT_432681 [Geopyxis carbonaria]